VRTERLMAELANEAGLALAVALCRADAVPRTEGSPTAAQLRLRLRLLDLLLATGFSLKALVTIADRIDALAVVGAVVGAGDDGAICICETCDALALAFVACAMARAVGGTEC